MTTAPAEKMTSYQQALDYLFTQTDYERMARVRHHAGAYDLGRMRRLCAQLGNPQDSFPSIHVAGTKGKGSVTTMAAHMLAAAGLRVGLYTSPHLIDLAERISLLWPEPSPRVLGRRCITPDELVGAMNVLVPAAERLGGQDHPTFFELMTALAFIHFAARGVGLAALEVGLGGRLDATNVVAPKVCAITAIGMDHTRQLGNTLELIAAEKAGIIKPAVPVVSAPQTPEVERVIRDIAGQRNAPVQFVGKEIAVHVQLLNHRQPRRWQVTVRTPGKSVGPLVCPLLGRHQATNLAVAVGMIEQLIEQGLPIDPGLLGAGLEQVVWPGRMDIRGQRPWVVLDGAHTVESIRAVLATLPETFDYSRLVVVAGCLSDKDLAGMMAELACGSAEVVLTRSDHPHAADPAELARLLSIAAPQVVQHVEPDAVAAVELARRLAGPDDLVLVTGSIYLVGLLARERV